jgi:four helix bundle protein
LRRRTETAYFRDLKVWQKAYDLTLAVYKATAGFPTVENYRLTDQLCRSSASIPANIAEGCGRGGDPELVRFLKIARGSANELEHHLLLARDLDLLPAPVHAKLEADCREIQRMVSSLIQTHTRSIRKGPQSDPAAS